MGYLAFRFRIGFIDYSADCVTIKSAHLSSSLVDISSEKPAEPKAASSVDWNTSLSG